MLAQRGGGRGGGGARAGGGGARAGGGGARAGAAGGGYNRSAAGGSRNFFGVSASNRSVNGASVNRSNVNTANVNRNVNVSGGYGGGYSGPGWGGVAAGVAAGAVVGAVADQRRYADLRGSYYILPVPDLSELRALLTLARRCSASPHLGVERRRGTLYHWPRTECVDAPELAEVCSQFDQLGTHQNTSCLRVSRSVQSTRH